MIIVESSRVCIISLQAYLCLWRLFSEQHHSRVARKSGFGVEQWPARIVGPTAAPIWRKQSTTDQHKRLHQRVEITSQLRNNLASRALIVLDGRAAF